MKVIAIETLRLQEHPEYLWVQVTTDAGLVGLGETMPRVAAVEQIVHDVLAPLLLGDDAAPEPFWHRAFQAISYHGWAGAELRALSALDIALWDVLGQAAGLPVHRLLGGPCRDRVRVYNTCVSHGAIRDHEGFLDDPAGLATDLVAAGYPAMKIWPFDTASTATLGQRIDAEDLHHAVAAFAAIRDAVGDAIDVALEGHSCWNLPSAIRIARALEPYEPLWLEDLIPATDPGAWSQLRAATRIPICGSERVFGRHGLRPFLTAQAVDIVKQDLCWIGGFTEFAKTASLAATHGLPVAPHNCHGPVGAMATLHAAAAIPNLYLMESVRAFAHGFFSDLVDDPPVIVDGWMPVPERPGLGVRLREDTFGQARRVRSEAGGVTATGWGSGDPWTAGSSDLGDRV